MECTQGPPINFIYSCLISSQKGFRVLAETFEASDASLLEGVTGVSGQENRVTRVPWFLLPGLGTE